MKRLIRGGTGRASSESPDFCSSCAPVIPGVRRNKCGSLVSNKAVKLIFTGMIFLLLFVGGAANLITQEKENSATRVSQDEAAPVGFRCPGRESNQSRPDVKLNLGDVTNKALELPQPKFPQAAKTARVFGAVQAEVVIDINSGKIVWSRVLKGHPLLQKAIRDVVCQARFSPTNDVDGRVRGILTYRFARRR
jgi:hypothetical protein